MQLVLLYRVWLLRIGVPLGNRLSRIKIILLCYSLTTLRFINIYILVRWRGKTTAVVHSSRHHAVALKQYDGYSPQAFPTPLASLSPPVQHYSVHGPGPPPTLRIAVTLSPTSPLHLLRPASVRVDDRLPPPPPLCNRYHRWWCRRRRRRRFMG